MAVVIGVYISDRYVTITSVTGESMYPTFTASNSIWGGIMISIRTYQLGSRQLGYAAVHIQIVWSSGLC